jgi:hypothetical protein
MEQSQKSKGFTDENVLKKSRSALNVFCGVGFLVTPIRREKFLRSFPCESAGQNPPPEYPFW